MIKLSEKAKEYEPKQVNNISELESVSTELDVKEAVDVEFPYLYVEIDNQRYKVPASVLGSLKRIRI